MTTATTVKCRIFDADDTDGDPFVLAYTTDKEAAITAAREGFGWIGYDDEANGPLTVSDPQLWRWIPRNRAGDLTLHPWDTPGPGAFMAIEVRP